MNLREQVPVRQGSYITRDSDKDILSAFTRDNVASTETQVWNTHYAELTFEKHLSEANFMLTLQVIERITINLLLKIMNEDCCNQLRIATNGC